MSLKRTIEERLDKLQTYMESNAHLKNSDIVYELTLSISKFWSVLDEEDREYVQMAQTAIEERLQWNIDKIKLPKDNNE